MCYIKKQRGEALRPRTQRGCRNVLKCVFDTRFSVSVRNPAPLLKRAVVDGLGNNQFFMPLGINRSKIVGPQNGPEGFRKRLENNCLRVFLHVYILAHFVGLSYLRRKWAVS